MSVTLTPPRPAETSKLEDRYWTTKDFYRAAAAGEFDEPGRLEIIQGRIIKKMPLGPRHSFIADIIAQALRDALRPLLFVREERPIHIAFDGEPIPDLSVIRGLRTDYRERHPSPEEVALLVEVADSSVDYDTGGKALLYAQAGITDYWVVLANEAAIVRHREPTSEGYQDVRRLAGADTISPLAAPDAVWTVRALLGGD